MVPGVSAQGAEIDVSQAFTIDDGRDLETLAASA